MKRGIMKYFFGINIWFPCVQYWLNDLNDRSKNPFDDKANITLYGDKC